MSRQRVGRASYWVQAPFSRSSSGQKPTSCRWRCTYWASSFAVRAFCRAARACASTATACAASMARAVMIASASDTRMGMLQHWKHPAPQKILPPRAR